METKYSLINGQLRIERRLNGQLHADYMPAVEVYNTNGIYVYEYYNNGKKNNNFGPAVRRLFNGVETLTEYWINGCQLVKL